ncbi:MAG: hypothetical protein Ta2G_12530 [Termitinemataceae bacterium]|nr:MAG: hypothetical protein Ta2G_12530 [Termitinemataceae bacterium]
MSLKQAVKDLCPPILWYLIKGIVPPIALKIPKKLKTGNREAGIKRAVNNILKTQKLIKLHLGCGTVYKDTWVNIDNNSDNNIEKIDINYDLRNDLPFPDNSVDFIFNEHFLEHLTVEEGQHSLRDFIRVKKRGVCALQCLI